VSDPASAFRLEGAAVILSVRLTPRSSRDSLEGFELLANGTTVLAARVRAIPENGEANAALEKLVAKAAGVAKSDASVVAGGTSRLKSVRVKGDPDAIRDRLIASLSSPT
jgi:uncharacterized protein YggU (UPF0235/DUF167 family)